MEYPVPESALKVVFSKEEIQATLYKLKEKIEEDYHGKELIVCGILNGAYVFLADLSRILEIPHQVDFLGLSSYGEGMESSGHVQITKHPMVSVKGKHVLVVEDIIDTGKTLEFIQNYFQDKGSLSVRICSLVVKESDHPRPSVDYVGFRSGREFLVGYGMDYAGFYRNLKDICRIEEEDSQGNSC